MVKKKYTSIFFFLVQNHPKDCSDLKHKHKKSGVYKIYPDNIKPFNVYCDMKTDGGSWMVSTCIINVDRDIRT